MEEKYYKLFDIIIKFLGFMVTAASIYYGLTNFNKQQTINAEAEYQRMLLEKQKEIYSEACESSGLIMANINHPKALEKEKIHFTALYYEMVLVENDDVSRAMQDILDCLKSLDIKKGNTVNDLNDRVLKLSKACRESLESRKARGQMME